LFFWATNTALYLYLLFQYHFSRMKINVVFAPISQYLLVAKGRKKVEKTTFYYFPYYFCQQNNISLSLAKLVILKNNNTCQLFTLIIFSIANLPITKSFYHDSTVHIYSSDSCNSKCTGLCHNLVTFRLVVLWYKTEYYGTSIVDLCFW
jgi:hypothetical protein